jgi:hypothetical protein
MMIFPSEWVHLVTPYTGNRPRITLSWNMHVRALPGKPEDPFSLDGADRRAATSG